MINQYERLENEKSAAGGMERRCPPAATAATINLSSDAPFAPAQDTLPCNTANSISPTVKRNRTDIRGIENMAVTAEAAEMVEEAKVAVVGAASWRRKQ